jgi:hypothetical protein
MYARRCLFSVSKKKKYLLSSVRTLLSLVNHSSIVSIATHLYGHITWGVAGVMPKAAERALISWGSFTFYGNLRVLEL